MFSAVQNQVVTVRSQITTTHGQIRIQDKIVDINHMAVHSAIEMHKVENKQECFEQVVGLFRLLLSEVENNEPG